MGKEIDRSNFWLVRNNPIIKTGVFPYLGRQIGPECEPEKIYNVLRPEEELFSDTAISSFNLIPITVGHALLGSRAEGFVPPEEKGVDGTTGENSKRQGDKVINDIKLYSERIKDEIQNGKKELSAGYFCDFVPERGVWNGRHYDFVQRNIAGNHIALVEKGRNGADVRVMDSAEGLPRRNRQFVCDAMDIEGKIEKHEGDMKKNANDANWDEGKHKRDSDGKFSSNGGSSAPKKENQDTHEDNLKKAYSDLRQFSNSEEGRQQSKKSSPGDFYKAQTEKFAKKYGVDPEKLRDYFADKVGKENERRSVQKTNTEWRKTNRSLSEAGLAPFSHKRKNASSTDENLSSKNHGNSGLDAATGKEMTMEQLKKAIEEIKALFANPEEGDKDAKLAEIISGLKDEPAAHDKCATDEDVDKRKLIDEIGGILNGKVDEELLRTVLKKAEEIAYNDSTDATADDEENDDGPADPAENKKASLDEMEKELLARMGRKTELVKRLTPIIGAFDSAAMTEKEVAAYACEKLGKKVAMDEAVNYLNGYLDAYKPASARVTLGAAPKSAAQDEALVNFLKGE